MSLVFSSLLCVAWTDHVVVKWLGKDAISALALDGKDGKGGNIEKITRWVAAGGRSVAQPGVFPHSTDCVLDLIIISFDCLVRDLTDVDGSFGQLYHWSTPM